MLNINWKGVDSNTISGLMICDLPPIVKPKMRTKVTTIDGRDGDIIEELGYESYSKDVNIALTRNYNVDEIIKYFTGEGNLILSNEPDKIYHCKIFEKIDLNKLLNFKTATVKFYAQPYKYLKDEKVIELDITEDVTSTEVMNVGLEVSKPIITLIGSGTIELKVNDLTIFQYTFPEEENEVTIDSLEEEAYLGSNYKNRNMLGEFPTFEVGKNVISWTGSLSKIIIDPKSRWL